MPEPLSLFGGSYTEIHHQKIFLAGMIIPTAQNYTSLILIHLDGATDIYIWKKCKE